MRVNVGCGQTPTVGWLNYDNSISLLLARIPGLSALLSRTGVLTDQQRRFIEFARSHRIRYANAVRHIPLASGSVEVLYSSHMIEHLDRTEVVSFLMTRPWNARCLTVNEAWERVDSYDEIFRRVAEAF